MAVGRLAPSALIADASAEAAALAAGLEAAYPQVNRGRRARIEPFQHTLVADTASSLQLLGAMALIMLVAGCANVAGLQLASLAGRRREIAVRAALGAGRARIARQIVVESLARASLGAALGLGAQYAVILFWSRGAAGRLRSRSRRAGAGGGPADRPARVDRSRTGRRPAPAWARDGGLTAIGAGDRSVGDRRTSRLRSAGRVSGGDGVRGARLCRPDDPQLRKADVGGCRLRLGPGPDDGVSGAAQQVRERGRAAGLSRAGAGAGARRPRSDRCRRRPGAAVQWQRQFLGLPDGGGRRDQARVVQRGLARLLPDAADPGPRRDARSSQATGGTSSW